eukprot:m.58180 g.58180  ORF g.58180 m.58180 type:complete len:117 (+) comp11247_c0_seq1:909-1259(+)
MKLGEGEAAHQIDEEVNPSNEQTSEVDQVADNGRNQEGRVDEGGNVTAEKPVVTLHGSLLGETVTDSPSPQPDNKSTSPVKAPKPKPKPASTPKPSTTPKPKPKPKPPTKPKTSSK